MQHQRGKPSEASKTTPVIAIDSRSRPPSPERFDADERDLWDRVILSRKPQFFLGAEPLLENFVVETIACRRIEMAMRKLKPGGKRHSALAKVRREGVRLCAALATKLRLTPSKIDRNLNRHGDVPLDLPDYGHPLQAYRVPDATALLDEHGQRSFERLRQAEEARGYRGAPIQTEHEPDGVTPVPAEAQSADANLAEPD